MLLDLCGMLEHGNLLRLVGEQSKIPLPKSENLRRCFGNDRCSWAY